MCEGGSSTGNNLRVGDTDMPCVLRFPDPVVGCTETRFKVTRSLDAQSTRVQLAVRMNENPHNTFSKHLESTCKCTFC